jgi:hypothetical protein
LVRLAIGSATPGRAYVARGFVTTLDVGWNEILTGHRQIRYYYYKREGDKLFIRTGEQSSGILPGRQVVGTRDFMRAM